MALRVTQSEGYERARDQFSAMKVAYDKAKRTKYFRGFIYGPVKAGKTVSLLTLPRPLLIHSFDPGGLDSIRDEIDKPGSEIYVVEFDVNNTELGAKHHYSNLEAGDIYPLWKDEFEWTRDQGLFSHFASFAMDSATTLFSAVTDYIVENAPTPKGEERALDIAPVQRDYNLIKTIAIKISANMLGLPCHFVLTGHKIEKDEGEGRFSETIALTPATRASLLPLFSEIYIADTIKKYVTNSDGEEEEVKQFLFRTEPLRSGSTAGSRSTRFTDGVPGKVLPKFIRQDFKTIFKAIGIDFEDKNIQVVEKTKTKKRGKNA